MMNRRSGRRLTPRERNALIDGDRRGETIRKLAERFGIPGWQVRNQLRVYQNRPASPEAEARPDTSGDTPAPKKHKATPKAKQAEEPACPSRPADPAPKRKATSKAKRAEEPACPSRPANPDMAAWRRKWDARIPVVARPRGARPSAEGQAAEGQAAEGQAA